MDVITYPYLYCGMQVTAHSRWINREGMDEYEFTKNYGITTTEQSTTKPWACLPLCRSHT